MDQHIPIKDAYATGAELPMGSDAALKRSIFTFPVFLIPTVRLIWNCALDQILFQSGIQIVLAESRFVRKTKSIHKFCSRKRLVTENVEKSLGRCFILVGYLVAVLVGAATNNCYLRQTITDDFEHKFYESCGRSHMDQHIPIKDAYATGAELPILRHKTVHHQFVCFEEVIHRFRI